MTAKAAGTLTPTSTSSAPSSQPSSTAKIEFVAFEASLHLDVKGHTHIRPPRRCKAHGRRDDQGRGEGNQLDATQKQSSNERDARKP